MAEMAGKRIGLAPASGQVAPKKAPPSGQAAASGQVTVEAGPTAERIIKSMDMGEYEAIDEELEKEVWANQMNLRELVEYRSRNGMTLCTMRPELWRSTTTTGSRKRLQKYRARLRT